MSVNEELFSPVLDDRFDPVWGQMVADILNRREMIFWTGDSNGSSGTGPFATSGWNMIQLNEGNDGDLTWKQNVTVSGDTRTRITPNRTGWYLCAGWASSNVPESEWVGIGLFRNGGDRAGDAKYGITGIGDYLSFIFWLPMNGTTDYLEFGWRAENGGELSDADLSVIWMKD